MADLKTPVKKNCVRCGNPYFAKRSSSWNCELCIQRQKEEKITLMNKARKTL